MKKATLRKTLPGALALMLLPSVGLAAKSWTDQIAPGRGGPQEQRGGAGREQSQPFWWRTAGGELMVGVIYMTSELLPQDRPYQCALTTYRVETPCSARSG